MSSGMWDGGDELFGTLSQETPAFTTHPLTLRKVYVTLHSVALSYSATILMINAAFGGELLLEKMGWLWPIPILYAVLRKPAVG